MSSKWRDIYIYIYLWLVGLLPLWKIWVRQFGWWHFHIFWENKIHVPNHESVYSEISSIVTEISSMIIGQLGKFIFINIYIYIYVLYPNDHWILHQTFNSQTDLPLGELGLFLLFPGHLVSSSASSKVIPGGESLEKTRGNWETRKKCLMDDHDIMISHV